MSKTQKKWALLVANLALTLVAWFLAFWGITLAYGYGIDTEQASEFFLLIELVVLLLLSLAHPALIIKVALDGYTRMLCRLTIIGFALEALIVVSLVLSP